MVRKKLYFDDVFADIGLVHTLNHATFKGAEIGECLAAASKVPAAQGPRLAEPRLRSRLLG